MHIASLFINFLVILALVHWLPQVGEFFSKRINTIALIALIWLLASATLYVLSPSYFNYIEASIASLGAYWLSGHNLYTEVFAQDRYSILYGPWPAMTGAFFMLPKFAIIPMSKLMGFLNLCLVLAVFSTLLPKKKILYTGLLALCFLGFDNFSYINRPDSFLIAYSAISLFLLESINPRNRIFFYVLTGILCGLCLACKIHSAIYFFPIAAFCFEKKKSSWSWGLALLSLVVAILVLLGLYLLPGVNAENFYFWLKATGGHGLRFRLFTDNASYSTPYLVILYLCGFWRTSPKTFSALIFSIFVACIFGSLVGAGTHHIIPFFALIIYFASLGYGELNQSQKVRAKVFITALVLALSYDAFISQKAIFKYFITIPQQVDQFKDLKNLRAKANGSVELGYGDGSQIEMSYFKSYFVRNGDTLLVDNTALMDMTASHIEMPEATLEVLERCKIPYMILPKTQFPWSQVSGFGFPLFSPHWIEVFKESYVPKENSEYYSLYKCLRRPRL